MGRLKEALRDAAGQARVGGRPWSDVSSSRRCPVCGGGSWCQVARDGLTILCKRIASGRARINRAGVEFHIHHFGGRPQRPVAVAPTPTITHAKIEDVDRAYRAALAALRLNDVDRDALRRRGLDDAAIDTNGYRTLSTTGRARVARAVVDAVGAEVASGVPGIVWRTADGQGWWSLGGWPGLLIPVRNPEDRIVALKVRRPDPCDGNRYQYITSRSHGGPSASAAPHVPLAAQAMRDVGAERLVVTEGELKADVATALLGSPVVSIPGVQAWGPIMDLLKFWGARRVVIAFDADASTNPVVARTEQALLNALRAHVDPDAGVWRWDPRWKGLDDFLAAQRRGEVDCGAK